MAFSQDRRDPMEENGEGVEKVRGRDVEELSNSSSELDLEELKKELPQMNWELKQLEEATGSQAKNCERDDDDTEVHRITSALQLPWLRDEDDLCFCEPPSAGIATSSEVGKETFDTEDDLCFREPPSAGIATSSEVGKETFDTEDDLCFREPPSAGIATSSEVGKETFDTEDDLCFREPPSAGIATSSEVGKETFATDLGINKDLWPPLSIPDRPKSKSKKAGAFDVPDCSIGFRPRHVKKTLISRNAILRQFMEHPEPELQGGSSISSTRAMESCFSRMSINSGYISPPISSSQASSDTTSSEGTPDGSESELCKKCTFRPISRAEDDSE